MRSDRNRKHQQFIYISWGLRLLMSTLNLVSEIDGVPLKSESGLL